MSEGDASKFNFEKFESEYDSKIASYNALLEEVLFILKSRIASQSIKIHAIEGRVKTKESIHKKCIDKNIEDPFAGLADIVGCRGICLFRSDIDKIEKIITENFDVVEKDDKINSSIDSFGYMSIHYICEIKKEFKGPRYDTVQGKRFEIQVRTLSMHAWAVISHYLDYKGEWDVPQHLKKALNALSGLFYVADDSFEKFYNESQKSKVSAGKQATKEYEEIKEVNLDTVRAYLKKKFPERKHYQGSVISTLVKELKMAGFNSIKEIDELIDDASPAFIEYEKAQLKGIPYFSDVGVARVSLEIISPAFFSARVANNPMIVGSDSSYKKYRNLIKNKKTN